jgi:hypothetical protein
MYDYEIHFQQVETKEYDTQGCANPDLITVPLG